MGRIPLGECSQSNHEAGEGAWIRKPNVKDATVLLEPSRRRPFGAYSILGVDVNATAKEITAAYRKLALACHPDKCVAQARSAATVRMKELNNAFDLLKDPDTRSKYDEKNKIQRTRNSPSSIRVAVHRARLTAFEKKVVSAIGYSRQKIKAKKNVDIRAKKKAVVVARKNLSQRSKVIKRPDSWVVLERPKKDLKDKRKKGLLAVPESCIKKKKKKGKRCRT